MADTDYRQDGATSIISMLGSIVAALGFEITDNAKAAVTMLKMQKEILEDASLKDFLTGVVSLKTIQNIATGVWYVPGKIISFIQKYLASESGGGYPGGKVSTDYIFVNNSDKRYEVPEDAAAFKTKFEYVNRVVAHFSLFGKPIIYYQTSRPSENIYTAVVFVRPSIRSDLTLLDNIYVGARFEYGLVTTEYTFRSINGQETFSTRNAGPDLTYTRTQYNSIKNNQYYLEARKSNTDDVYILGHNLGTSTSTPGGGITRGGGVGRPHGSLPKDENFPPCGGDTTVPQITEWSNRVINWNNDCYMPLTYYKVNPSNENPGIEPGSPSTPIEPDDPRLDPESPVYNPSIPGDIIKYFYPNDYVQSTPQNGDNTVQTTGQLKDNYTNSTNGPSDIPSTDIKGGLYTLWHPSADNLQKLGAFLYGGTTQGTIASIIGDPINAIIQLTEWAVTPVDGPVKSPVICNIGATELKMPTIPNQFMQFDCGTIEIPREYHDFRDYEPYTRLSLFLPFVGDVNISTNDCITPHKIHVIYNIDFLSGVACAEVLIDEDVRYAYQAAMCAAVPVTSSDASRLIASIIGAAAGTVGGGVMGGIVGGTAGSRMAARALIGGASEVAMSPINGIQTQRTGSISANTGLLGEMKPYVLVTRPISVVADQYKSLLGQPYQLDGTLGSQKGFVKVREVHLDGVTATETEKNEIERMLKEGVIL